MPIQRDLIRSKPWNGEISAKNARALRIKELRTMLGSSAPTASAPANSQLPLPACSGVKNADLRKPSESQTLARGIGQCELHLPDESRFHEVITLRKCPWCHQKPVIITHKHLAQVVHRNGMHCEFGPKTPGSVEQVKRAWNLAVKLCR